MTDRPTPETDAIEKGMFGSDLMLIADHARRLERERDEARQRLFEASRMGVDLLVERDDTRTLLREIYNLTQIGDPHAAGLPMRALQAIAEMIDEQWKEKQ